MDETLEYKCRSCDTTEDMPCVLMIAAEATEMKPMYCPYDHDKHPRWVLEASGKQPNPAAESQAA